MNAEADAQGFIVVYPNGTGSMNKYTFNAEVCCGTALKKGVDDITFITDLINYIYGRFCSDGRFYMCGFSNGGVMTYYYAEQLISTGKLKGISVVEGATPSVIKTPPAIPMMQFHGTLDTHVPYSGGYGEDSFEPVDWISVEDNIAYWNKINNTSTTPLVTDTRYYTLYNYPAKSISSKPVILYKIKGGGHTWAGGNPPPIDLGPLISEVNINKIMLSFFKDMK
jgi:polyhydroxybutyrate depolymerase